MKRCYRWTVALSLVPLTVVLSSASGAEELSVQSLAAVGVPGPSVRSPRVLSPSEMRRIVGGAGNHQDCDGSETCNPGCWDYLGAACPSANFRLSAGSYPVCHAWAWPGDFCDNDNTHYCPVSYHTSAGCTSFIQTCGMGHDSKTGCLKKAQGGDDD